MSLFRSVAVAMAVGAFSAGSLAEMIFPSQSTLTVGPGEVGSVFFLISGSQTPLFGYSLDIEITANTAASTGGALGVGSVSVHTGLTNFFDARNLITAGGLMRDPLFSVILPTGDGAFTSTNSANGNTVLAAAGVNEVLAQVFFRASPDAGGSFQVGLGTASALSDAAGFPVPFSSTSLTIIIPTHSMGVILLVAGSLTTGRGQRRRAGALERM